MFDSDLPPPVTSSNIPEDVNSKRKAILAEKKVPPKKRLTQRETSSFSSGGELTSLDSNESQKKENNHLFSAHANLINVLNAAKKNPAFFLEKQKNNQLTSAVEWTAVAMLHTLGIGTPINKETAFQCFKTATECDNQSISAWIDLGDCYLKGIGTPPKTEEAYNCYKTAYKLNKNFAITWDRLGMYLLHTVERRKNTERAVEYFRQAIRLDKNFAVAWNNLGYCLLNGIGTTINPEAAFGCFQTATTLSTNFAEAWGNLWICYESGKGTRQNGQLAVHCFNNTKRIMHGLPGIPIGASFNPEPNLLAPPAPIVFSAPRQGSPTEVEILKEKITALDRELRALKGKLDLKDAHIAFLEKGLQNIRNNNRNIRP